MAVILYTTLINSINLFKINEGAFSIWGYEYLSEHISFEKIACIWPFIIISSGSWILVLLDSMFFTFDKVCSLLGEPSEFTCIN